MPNGNEQQEIFEEILLHEPPPLRVKHARIPVERLEFDPENPRLKYLKELNPGKSEIELLFEGEDTKWLRRDIKERGVIDAIYVKLLPVAAGDPPKYKVVEGNRRTACSKDIVRELSSEGKEIPARNATLPARILPSATSEVQTALLMASFHVAGKVKWDAHEKAGHIYHLLHVLRVPESELASVLHMAIPTIKRTAESYKILQEVYRTVDGGIYEKHAGQKWSFFSEMLKNKDLRTKHENDPRWCEKYSRWVGEGRIPRAEDVRELPAILSKSNALRTFESDDPKEAFVKAKREADTANPANASKFYKQLEKLLDMTRHADLQDVLLAGENDQAKLLLQDTVNALTTLMERAGVRLSVPGRRVA